MKQGQANSNKTAGTKVEPIPHAVSPAGVDQLGQSVFFKKVPIYEGRGLEAPMVGEDSHPKGSQGKY